MVADKLYVCIYFILSSIYIAISLHVCFTKYYQFWEFYALLFFCMAFFFCFLAVSRVMDILNFLRVGTLEQLRKEQDHEKTKS